MVEMNNLERPLRQIIDEIPALVWSCLSDGSVEFISKQWLKYGGLSHKAAQDLPWKSVAHPDDLENLMSKWCHHLTSGEPFEAEARLRRFDGEYRWFLIRAVPLRDALSNVIKWYGTNTDID